MEKIFTYIEKQLVYLQAVSYATLFAFHATLPAFYALLPAFHATQPLFNYGAQPHDNFVHSAPLLNLPQLLDQITH